MKLHKTRCERIVDVKTATDEGKKDAIEDENNNEPQHCK